MIQSMSRRRLLVAPAVLAAGLLALAACAPNNSGQSSSGTPSPMPTTANPPSSSSVPTPDDPCAKDKLSLINAGKLTVGTDSPAYPPYFEDDDPSNGKGFESAVAYAVAKNLGFTPEEVQWVVEPFNKSYAPGSKDFDFDINQISITPKRAEVVTFSDGYYTVNQAVVALADSSVANATSLAQLQAAKLGAQVGTTSLSYITDFIKPSQEPYVYNDTNDAKTALRNGQIDAIVVDLPTAFYITAVEIPKGKIVGQFPAVDGGEQFGILLQKDNPLAICVNKVLSGMKDSGELEQITNDWLVGGADAPYFTE